MTRDEIDAALLSVYRRLGDVSDQLIECADRDQRIYLLARRSWLIEERDKLQNTEPGKSKKRKRRKRKKRR